MNTRYMKFQYNKLCIYYCKFTQTAKYIVISWYKIIILETG
jgi:hypothetical protein